MPTNLTIPEIKGNFYGGFPYSVDLQIGTFDTPSTLSISVISENGLYSQPKLSYKDVVSIQLGSLTFNGYLVEYKKNRSIGQKTLDLSYEDCSNILDKIQIGLHKRHGLNPNGISYTPTMNYKGLRSNLEIQKNPYLIILGRELHPCDKNKNGIIDSEDIVAGSQIDWCDPCPNCPPDKFKYRCKDMNDLQIFDVGYSFDELCSALNIPVPDIESITTILRTYTGTLRNVLQSWCNEFALSFYWNFGAKDVQNGLVLFDRSVPITVNNEIDECKATEILEGESIKNNFATSTISYYQRSGANKSYPCGSSEFYTLHALRLRDLLNEENYQDIDTKIRWNELAICLSYYSTALRDSMWWFNYYGIKNATKAKEWVVDPFLSKLRGSRDKTLKPFGNMKILKVIDASSEPSLFSDCKSQLGDSLKDYDKRSQELKRTDDNPSYYFFVAEYDKELLSTQANRDADLASNFIGRHWIKLTNGPGCDGGNANIRFGGIDVQDPEGGASWHSVTGDSIFADFTKFGHEQGSKIDSFLQDNNVSAEDAPRTAVNVDIGGGAMKEFKVTQSLIYKKRNPAWYPNSSELTNYQSILNYYNSLCWTLVGVAEEGQDSEILKKINPTYVSKNHALFIVQEIDENVLPITISEVKNFLEPDKLKPIRGNPQDNETCMSFNDVNQSQGSEQGPILGEYGLVENKCAWVTFDGFGFMAPVQATELVSIISNSSLDKDASFESGGYKVMATSSFNMPVCIPKIQQSVVQVNTRISDCPRHELNFMEISDDDISIFGSNSCSPSQDAIKNIHAAKSAALSKSKIGAEKISEYQMVGVAPDGIPSIGSGLDSLKISINDNGVFTNFSLSDKISQPFSEAVILNQILMSRQFLRSEYKTIGDYSVKNPGNSQIPNR